MSAGKVLDLAVEQGLLEPKVLNELRKQIAESKFVVTPEAIAKVLVDHGHLTPFQARKLVAAAVGQAEPEPAAAKPPPPAPAKSPDSPAKSPAPPVRRRDVPDELTLADDGSSTEIPLPAPSPIAEEIVDLEPVEPAPKPKPQAPFKSPPSPPKATPTAKAKRAPAPKPAEEEIIDLEPVRPSKPAAAPAPRAPSPPRHSSPAPPAPAPVAEGLVPLTPLPPSGPATAVAAAAAPTATVKPIDDLFGDPMSAATDPLASSALLGEPPAKAERKRKKIGNVWDSPLLLLGGGALGVMLIAIGLLFYSLTRGSAAELFSKAEADYEAGSYSSAIKGYETYLKNYPDDPEASKARVRRGMAQLRQVTDGGKNPRQGLQVAKEVLPQIETEASFNDARIELSSILPDVADGFAALAGEADSTAKKEELVKLANEAMELVNSPTYIPASLRKDRAARIAAIIDKINVAQRSIDQDKELASAIAKIGEAAQKGDAAAAYKVRTDLLRVYPGLEAHADLQAAILKVGERESELVQVTQPAAAAQTDDPAPVGARVILAERAGPTSGGNPRSVFVLAEGSVYALDVATGQILWRRYVGYQTRIHPVAAAQADGNDALVVDGRDHQLLRLNGITGAVVWRQPIGEPFATPVVDGERALVTTRQGRLLEIALASGEIAREAKLPQGATMPVAVDARQKRLLQLGEHSTLFVLNSQTLAGVETFYLGHRSGAIFVPPVSVLDHVLVPESPGDDATLIHVIAADEKSKRLVEIGRPFRLRGRVLTPLAVSKRRVAALTDLGQVAVLEVDGTNKQQPVRQIASVEAAEKPAITPWYALDDNRLWAAGNRCVLLEVQPSLQQISRKWTLHQDDVFVSPLQVVGSTLVHVRRRNGWPGIVVEGCSGADGQALWTTHLGVPIVALEVSDSRKAVDALTASGRLYTLTGQQLAGGIVDAATFTPPPGSAPAILPAATHSSDGTALVWTEARAGGHIYEYNVAAGAPPAATDLPPGAAAAVPVQVWGGRYLTPLTSGGLALLEAKSGMQSVQPFLPPVSPSALPKWTQPALLPDGTSCLISDGRRSLFRVALQNQPQPHLAQAVEAPTEPPIVSPLVAAGGTVYGWRRGEAADTILAIDPQALPAMTEIPLQGHVQAGPFAVGGLAFVVSEPEGLLCLEAGGKVRWQKPLTKGPLAGSPLALADGDLLVIYQAGSVCRVSADTGDELGGGVDLAQPLGAAVRVLGQQVFLAGSDGVIHRAPLPARP
jgi:outer membrane protein assembly factor BamB